MPDTSILDRKTESVETPKTEAQAKLAAKLPSGKRIRVIGVPLDLGQSRRGVDMGPSAVRVAGLEARLEALGHKVEDGGNIAVAIAETKKSGDPHAKYLKEIDRKSTRLNSSHVSESRMP